MPNSSQNRVTRRYGVPGRWLRVDVRGGRDIVHDGLTRALRQDGADMRSCSSVIRPMTQPDRQNTAPWSSSILAFFMEGFALYGASYCASPQAIAPSSVESSPAKASAPPREEISWRERRRAVAMVSSLTRAEVTEVADDANRARPESETAFGTAFFDTDRSSRSNWLTKP
jgi:hypothetical protein